MAENSKIEWTETGRSLASNGYVLVRVGKAHPLADIRGYAYEHRLVASATIGRWIDESEQVHHRNEIKTDNRPENLEVVASIAEHQVKHRKRDVGLRMPGEDNPQIECLCGCGERFLKFDDAGRPRKFVSGHNPPIADAADRFISALASGPKNIRQIQAATGQSPIAVKVMASKLRKVGKIRRIKHGVYAALGDSNG